MAGMWLAHSVLRCSSTFWPTCGQTQDADTHIEITALSDERGRGREAEEQKGSIGGDNSVKTLGAAASLCAFKKRTCEYWEFYMSQ